MRFVGGRATPARIAALSLAVAATGTLVACGSDDKPTRLSGSATTTTAAPVTTVAPDVFVPDTTTTTARSGAATTAVNRPSPTSPPVIPAPAALSPPVAGRYQYNTTGSTALGATTTPLPGVTSLVVDPASGVRQHSVRSLKDAGGQGLSTDYDLEYRADGVYLVGAKVNITLGTFITNAGLLPTSPVLFVPSGATIGFHTEADIPTDTGSPVKFVVDVVRTETVNVAGASVDALVVRTVATSLPGAPTTTRQELTLWFDRGSRLVVKESSVITASAAAGLVQFRANSDSTIQTLRP